MKVNKASKIKKSKKSKNKKSIKPGMEFSQVINEKRNELDLDYLKSLMETIEELGNELVHSRKVEDLMAYRKNIKAFIEEAVEYGLKINQRRGFRPGARSKILRTVATVDEKLLELTDAVVKQEANQLVLLKKIGQIKGLLVSLYL